MRDNQNVRDAGLYTVQGPTVFDGSPFSQDVLDFVAGVSNSYNIPLKPIEDLELVELLQDGGVSTYKHLHRLSLWSDELLFDFLVYIGLNAFQLGHVTHRLSGMLNFYLLNWF